MNASLHALPYTLMSDDALKKMMDFLKSRKKSITIDLVKKGLNLE